MASVLGPIDTLPLFPDLGAGLVALLGSLSPSDWQKPTIHRDRNVKDLGRVRELVRRRA